LQSFGPLLPARHGRGQASIWVFSITEQNEGLPMRKGSIAVLSLLLAAAFVPTAVEARSYSDNSYRYTRHAKTSDNGYRNTRRAKTSHRRSGHRYAKKSSGTSATCLTSAARNLLGRIRNQFGNVQIVSTCRPGARIAGTRTPSKHASGQAIDFRVPGKKREVVRWLIANHRSGGVMTYNDMDHIHVDVGAHFVALNRPSGRT
jgi:uncharacterized protein YcbK (DUF882 family)